MSPPTSCLVDLDAEWEVGEAGYESRSANCAFAGRRLTGRVRMTVADGAVAYRERTLRPGSGRLVAPARVLDRGRAALVVVDVQEAFRPAVLDFDRVAAGAATLVRGARIILDLPVIVTQQYPKGLGRHRARAGRVPRRDRADRQGLLLGRRGRRLSHLARARPGA